ncbi:MAG: hypothetical protein V3R24_01315, partial [Gemmatimonadales bacterium]
ADKPRSGLAVSCSALLGCLSNIVNEELDFGYLSIFEFEDEITIKTLQGITETIMCGPSIRRIP